MREGGGGDERDRVTKRETESEKEREGFLHNGKSENNFGKKIILLF